MTSHEPAERPPPAQERAPTARRPAQPADPWLNRFREIIAASLGGLVVLATVVLVAVAISEAGDAQRFARIKDLLLFVNPLVGYVIGYYFSKVTGEARAESAESVARDSSRAAEQAVQASGQAIAAAEEARGSLAELEQAATTLAASPRRTLGDVEGARTPDPELLAALARARRVLGRKDARS